MHKLTIDSKENIFLDDKKLDCIKAYELKHSAEQTAELRLILSVTISQVAFESKKK